MAGRKGIGEGVIQKIILLSASGESYRRIAKTLNISVPSVQKYTREYSAEIEKNRREFGIRVPKGEKKESREIVPYPEKEKIPWAKEEAKEEDAKNKDISEEDIIEEDIVKKTENKALKQENKPLNPIKNDVMENITPEPEKTPKTNFKRVDYKNIKNIEGTDPLEEPTHKKFLTKGSTVASEQLENMYRNLIKTGQSLMEAQLKYQRSIESMGVGWGEFLDTSIEIGYTLFLEDYEEQLEKQKNNELKMVLEEKLFESYLKDDDEEENNDNGGE